MGRYRESTEVLTFPAKSTVTWHNEEGNAYYICHDDLDKKMLLTAMNFVIVEPRTFCVTGKERATGFKVKSNLALYPDYPKLRVYKDVRVGNTNEKRVIAVGSWKGENGIYQTVKGSGGQWTKNVFILLRSAKAQMVNADKSLGPVKNVVFPNGGELAQLRLRGDCIRHAGEFVEQYGTKFNDMDGYYVSQSEILTVYSEAQNKTYKYPKFVCRELDVAKLAEKEADEICQKAFDLVSEYLSSHWAKTDSLIYAPLVNLPRQGAPSPAPSTPNNYPVIDAAEAMGNDGFDDLPF